MGDFNGELRIHDLETGKASFKLKAHKKIINGLDAIGGAYGGNGAPEILTGGSDGCVRLWDPRQQGPVSLFGFLDFFCGDFWIFWGLHYF